MTIGVPIVTGLPRLYQQCTNRQKQSKDSQNSKNDYWCTNRHRSIKTVPTVYKQCTDRQKQSKQSKTVKRQLKQQNDYWCTNRHRSTKPVGLPTVYQQCSNRQKQPKDSQNSKYDYFWCTNRHMSTQSPPITQSPRPPSASAECTKPKIASPDMPSPCKMLRLSILEL